MALLLLFTSYLQCSTYFHLFFFVPHSFFLLLLLCALPLPLSLSSFFFLPFLLIFFIFIFSFLFSLFSPLFYSSSLTPLSPFVQGKAPLLPINRPTPLFSSIAVMLRRDSRLVNVALFLYSWRSSRLLDRRRRRLCIINIDTFYLLLFYCLYFIFRGSLSRWYKIYQIERIVCFLIRL